MTGYTKKIAVIKQVKNGFSSDGGALSGLVKAETYAGFLKVDVSLINFAPLSEGRYVLGISDGLKTVVFEGATFEGESDINLSCGFAFLVCFCNGNCAPIASAACGQMACALPDLKEEMAKIETAKVIKKPKQDKAGSDPKAAAYDDEAIAEENYYEYNSDEDGGAVRQDKTQKKDGRASSEDEEAVSAVKVQKERLTKGYAAANAQNGNKKTRTTSGKTGTGGTKSGTKSGLAGGDFYQRMRPDIEKIFTAYPRAADLESAMEGSRWAKISYGEGKFYVFGVLNVEGSPRYLCYGVPSKNPLTPPKSLQNSATFMPVEGGGYWIMYQDANTGVSVKMTTI